MSNRNRYMKKTFIIPGIMLLLFLFLFSIAFYKPVFAAECAGVNTSLIECQSTAGGGAIREVLMIVVNALTIGVGILAVIGIAVAGIQYLTARDNEQQVTKAKRRIFEIVVGIGVYIVMWGLMQWLLPGGINIEDVAVSSVSLPQKATFFVNGYARVVPSISPLDANDQSLTWTSSDPSVASVDSKGNITTKSAGTTTITATSANGKTASTTIEVKPEPVEIDEREAYKHQSGSSGSSGSLSKGKGLTEAQAHKLADYYNSPEVNICSIANTCNKNDCSAFTAWFLVTFTDLKTNRLQQGIDTFWVDTRRYNFGDNIAGVPQQSNNPGAISIVSTNVGAGVPFNGSTTHVGVIVGYDGTTSMTVEAAAGTPGWNAHVFHHVFANGLAYNNIDDHVDYDKLSKIVGN